MLPLTSSAAGPRQTDLRLSCMITPPGGAVRYRMNCVLDEPGDFMEGVPAAIRYVLSNHTKPAVMLLDSWCVWGGQVLHKRRCDYLALALLHAAKQFL